MTAILAFLSALSPYASIVLDIAGWLLNLFGGNQQNLAAYQKMIDDANSAGDLSAEAYSALNAHRTAIEAREKAKAQIKAAQILLKQARVKK